MEKATFNIPAMWADHHVLVVREALGSVDGVDEVIASSLYRDVLVKYDQAKVDPARLVDALESAGYDTATTPVLPAYPERIDDTSDWFQFQERVTVTDQRDLEMSGDHRKY
jgi:copper chaperone CopZ